MKKNEHLPSWIFEQILENHPDLILIKGENAKLVWGNRAFRELYGMSNEQLHNLIDSPINNVDYTQQYVIDDQWVWQNKKPLQIDCEPVTRHDGSPRKLKTLKLPLIDSESNEVLYTVGLSHDITEHIEDQLRMESSSKMASLGEMAGGIAHEINNPIGVISAKARQLRQHLESNLPKDHEKMLTQIRSIESYSERVSKIVLGLRQFSRNADSDPTVEISCEKILEDTLTLCESTLKKQNIQLEKKIDPQLILNCRPVQISQVLINLMGNAADALQNNDNKKIFIETFIEEGHPVIRVWDNGPGIPDDIAVKVLQPFFTTKPTGKGTGLGLSISHSLMKQNEGHLVLDRIHSKSCFKLIFKKYKNKENAA